MQAMFYVTDSTKNALMKQTTIPLELDIKFKAETSIINPEIFLKKNSMITERNYCYIPSLKRYYFITDISSVNSQVFKLKMECDVLMTYRDDILASTATVTRCKAVNPFGNMNLDNEVRKEVLKYENGFAFSGDMKMALVAIGG